MQLLHAILSSSIKRTNFPTQFAEHKLQKLLVAPWTVLPARRELLVTSGRLVFEAIHSTKYVWNW